MVYKPKQINKVSNVAQVTDGRKRSKEQSSQVTRRGRPRRQSRSPEHQEHETTGDMGRRSSQEAICECSDCRQRPERSMEAMVDPMETGRGRLKFLATKTPEPRSRTNSRTRPGARSPSPTTWTPEPRIRTESRSRPGAESWEGALSESRYESPTEERIRMEARDHRAGQEGVKDSGEDPVGPHQGNKHGSQGDAAHGIQAARDDGSEI